MKMTLTHFLAGMFLAVTTAWSAEEATEPLVLRADLNGDGRPENITRRRLGSDSEMGVFFQLLVSDANGSQLWKSPEVHDTTNPMAFGSWDFGVSLPELAADIDNDGKVELLTPAPQSDVSPTFHRVLRWNGTEFKPAFSKALSGPGRKGAVFTWTEAPKPSDFWVLHWLGASAEGGWVVELYALPKGDAVQSALAVIVPRNGAFELLRWIHPPEVLGVGDASTAITYRARLSEKDHASSAGAALTTVADILRQDRANVHREAHRDAEDEVDGRFATKEDREALGSLTIQVEGGAAAEQQILRGTPLIEVRIEATNVSVKLIK